LSRLVVIAYLLETGLVLLVIPWTTFWERNFFVDYVPWLRGIVVNHFARGAVSGLGFVNVCAGFADLFVSFFGARPVAHSGLVSADGTGGSSG
jgi:hypothetical protein